MQLTLVLNLGLCLFVIVTFLVYFANIDCKATNVLVEAIYLTNITSAIFVADMRIYIATVGPITLFLITCSVQSSLFYVVEV